MASTTTIRDVAEWVGVSSATVSNVINGKKGRVSESTRHEVWSAIEKLNYRPNAARSRRPEAATKNIGIVIREVHNPYFSDIIVGAQNRARENGHSLVISSSEGGRETEKALVELFLEKEVDGLIVNPLLDRDADLAHLFKLKRRNVPFVLLERVHGIRSNLVDVDNVQAAREMTSHLVDLGHERIIHFAGPDHSMHASERVEGFRRAFFESKMVYSEEYVVQAGARLEDGYRAGMEYFQNCTADEHPTAVSCYNDLVAIGLMRALNEIDLTVPDDISVTGFDDIRPARYGPVPLTTMAVPTLEMGRSAIDVLLQHIESGARSEPDQVSLDSEMMIRASTAPPA